MPQDGAMLLSDVTTDKLRIECDCGLSRQYDVAALRGRTEDIGLPELKDRLAKAEGCRKVGKHHVYDKCRAKYVGLPWQGPTPQSPRTDA